MDLSVEIIDFTVPVANSKNLYISGIVTNDLNENQIMATLYEACQLFGLVYEVQVFPGVYWKKGSSDSKLKAGIAAYYAFVKYYSYHAAQKAKAALSKQLTIGSQPCKVSFAKRSKEICAGQMLCSSRCIDLANFYLGFTGWTSAIKRLEEDTCHNPVAGNNISARFWCVLELAFPQQGVITQGVGAWEEVVLALDPVSKMTARHIAHKRSQQRALQHAFSRVLLVVMGNSKVFVEIDTTKPDGVPDVSVSGLDCEQMLKITELAEDPDSDDDISVRDASLEMDHANLHILQELEDS